MLLRIAAARLRTVVFLSLAGSMTLMGGCARETAPAMAHNSFSNTVRSAIEDAGDAESSSEDAPAAAQPTGWATISGSFKLSGAAPSRSPLVIDKDTEVCSPGGMAILDESVVVGDTGGLQNVLVFLAAKIPDDPAWVHESYEEAKYGEVIFDQKQCIFLSHVAAMRATQKLKVLNSDPVGHNTNLDSKRGAAAGNFTVPAGGFAQYEPGAPSPAPFPVSCSIHPWMKAWMMVCDSPYFAVTRDDGSFQIANIPAGVELEFRVWQESAGYLQEVNVNGQGERWSKGRFSLTLDPDETYVMDVAVESSVFD